MGFTAETLERQFNEIIEQQSAESQMWLDIEKRFDAPIGTSVPALYSVFYKFIQNPSTVSVDTFKRMLDTDDTIGSGIDFLTTALSARIGKYQHKSNEITEWMNGTLDAIEGGWFNKVKEMLSACWAGYFVGEKVWHNTDRGWVIDRITPLPPTSILFEVDHEGRLEPDGILQYQRNVNPFGVAQNFNFFGGLFAGGFSLGGGIPFENLKVDPFAKMGDMPYPIRNANSFLYLSVRIPRDKCVHYAFDSQGKMGNPYGRSILRRAFNAYVAKAQTIQMMLRALDRKGTPLMLVYAAPNATVKDPNKASPTLNNKGRNVGMDAGRSASQVFANIHNDSVVTLPGKKGQIYDVDVVPMDAHADQFIQVIQHFDRAALRSMLIPSLIFSSGDGGGSYALGETHSKTWDKICDGYNEGLKQTIREQIIRPLLMYNFPKSTWDRDGIGDFTKRELSQDERQKETENIEKAVNLGVMDLTNLADFNAAREKFGLEAMEAVPARVAEIQQQEIDTEDDGGDGNEPPSTETE
jgi:hypothetical protein